MFRQTEAQQAWLASHPDIREERVFVDEGVSGSNGEHIETGELSGLVKLVEKGDIEPGSLIVVEHLSSISRLDIDTTEDLLKKFGERESH